MIVLIDVGNTRVKLGWWDARLGREPAVTALNLHDDAPDLSSLSVLSMKLGKWLSSLPSAASGACGVSVAGKEVTHAIEQALASMNMPTRWMQPQAQTLDMTNRYEQPGQLGADRWAALLGVAGCYRRNSLPIILATFGTATTIDTLGPNAVFEGGMILPGPVLMRSSLASGTAKLPLAHGGGVAFPRNTDQAISTGVLSAQAGALWRQCMMVREAFGVWPRVCVSGGAWPEVEQEVRRVLSPMQTEIQYLAHPALDGLARLAAQDIVA